MEIGGLSSGFFGSSKSSESCLGLRLCPRKRLLLVSDENLFASHSVVPFSTNSSSSIVFLPAASSNDSIPACRVCICSLRERINSFVQPERRASFASFDIPVHMSLISIHEFCSLVRMSSKNAERTSLSVTPSLPGVEKLLSIFT